MQALCSYCEKGLLSFEMKFELAIWYLESWRIGNSSVRSSGCTLPTKKKTHARTNRFLYGWKKLSNKQYKTVLEASRIKFHMLKGM